MKVIIVGAGAAGLMAAYDLTRKGAHVVMLEAQPRPGGRIDTLTPEGFLHQVEGGAEFIHGKLPLTEHLLAKSAQTRIPAEGDFLRYQDGKFLPYGQGGDWDAFYTALAAQRKDITVADFLKKRFPDNPGLYNDVHDLAQGLDLADPERLSLLSVREEWLGNQPQSRPGSGYGKLIEFLAAECARAEFDLHLETEVTTIGHFKTGVSITTNKGLFKADIALLTIPHWHYGSGSIQFDPELPETRLFEKIGYGQVIKAVMEFEHPFWEKELPGLGFLFMDEGFTFWTQHSGAAPLLTLWIGDRYAATWDAATDERITTEALIKLSTAFGENISVLRASKVFRYTHGSEMGGAYSWLMPGSKDAVRRLNRGFGNVFFAGEALEPSFAVGTVDAAFKSGRYAARRIAGSFMRQGH